MKNINRLFVEEVYIIENGICKGWQKVGKYMTIKNINKMFKEGNVETVNVMEDKEEFIGRDFNYKTFRIEYPTLETFFERLVEESVDKIRFEQGVEISENIKEIIELESAFSNWNGMYYFASKKISIQMSFVRNAFNDRFYPLLAKRKENQIIAVIVHEIGHYIHDKINKMEPIKLPVENKSQYAKTNHMEDFAESFRDYIMQDRKTLKRDMAMMNILSEGGLL